MAAYRGRVLKESLVISGWEPSDLELLAKCKSGVIKIECRRYGSTRLLSCSFLLAHLDLAASLGGRLHHVRRPALVAAGTLAQVER